MVYFDSYETDSDDLFCPECDEPLDDSGLCPNGCLDLHKVESEEDYHDDLDGVNKGDIGLYETSGEYEEGYYR